jgi:hypothetical protein
VTSFRVGTYCENPVDTRGYNNEPLGAQRVTFDTTNPKTAAVAQYESQNIFVSEDADSTWTAVPSEQIRFHS